MLYAVKTPNGKILEYTATASHSDAVVRLFWVVSDKYKGWSIRYWKKWNPAYSAAKKLGWRIVKVKVTEVR